jgi:Flp pilus assembly protein TadD
VAQSRQQNFAEAIKNFQSVLMIDPANLKAQANLGVTLMEAKNYPDAISALHAAILLAPNDADLRTNLGIALERSGKPKEARQAYDEAKKLKVLPATHSAAVAKP